MNLDKSSDYCRMLQASIATTWVYGDDFNYDYNCGIFQRFVIWDEKTFTDKYTGSRQLEPYLSVTVDLTSSKSLRNMPPLVS